MSTTEKIQMKLSDSASARWTALFIVSVTMMFGYFFTDVMSPLEPLLTEPRGQRTVSDSDGVRMSMASSQVLTDTSMCSSCSSSSVVLSSTSLASVSLVSSQLF